jgi:hypothetical protein
LKYLLIKATFRVSAQLMYGCIQFMEMEESNVAVMAIENHEIGTIGPIINRKGSFAPSLLRQMYVY